MGIKDITLITAIIGASTGVGGLLLGVINIWKQVISERVKLRVTPMVAFGDGRFSILRKTVDKQFNELLKNNIANSTNYIEFAIEVSNLSSFPITISRIGWGSPKSKSPYMPFPRTRSNKGWPTRLASREAEFLLIKPEHFNEDLLSRRIRVFVITDCGKVAYGTSPAFKRYIKQLMKFKKQRYGE